MEENKGHPLQQHMTTRPPLEYGGFWDYPLPRYLLGGKSCEAISKLLTNKKYIGDFVLGKTHIVDGIQVRPHDDSKQILMRDHHAAIISLELFRIVQQEKLRRRSRSLVGVR